MLGVYNLNHSFVEYFVIWPYFLYAFDKCMLFIDCCFWWVRHAAFENRTMENYLKYKEKMKEKRKG